MNENDIRDYFSKNWVFWLVKHSHPVAIILGIPLLIFIIGIVISALIHKLDLFLCNLLAYPLGLVVALAAYTWFAIYFPKYLEQIYPAFDASPEEFGKKIKKWADLFANRFWIIGLASLLIGFLNYLNLDALWYKEIWLGDVWANSSAPTFFKIYYAFVDVIAGGFVLGSGAIGIIGVLFLLYDLLSLRIKLSHVRLLRAIVNLSIGLSFWSLLALAFVGPIRAVSARNILCVSDWRTIIEVDSSIILSNLGTSILASIVVVCSLLLPVYFSHQSIIRDKNLRISNLLEIQAELFTKADCLSNLYKSALAREDLRARKKRERRRLNNLNEELQQTYENIANVNTMIEEVESVPEWPITASGVGGIIFAAISPTLSNLVVSLLPGQTGPIFIKGFKEAIPDILQKLFK